MSIFWPGLIIGMFLVVVCTIAYVKRDAVSDMVERSISLIIGNQAAKKFEGSHDQRVGHLLLPIFGGIAMGVAGIIFSLTGVMR